MNQKIVRVFISSTFLDLSEERKKAVKTIGELNPSYEKANIHLYPVDLKAGARPNPPKEECIKEVETSDILIGILGSRYGYIDPESDKSITEIEYECAKEKNIDCLYYICTKDVKQEWIEEDKKKTRLELFKSQIDANHKRDTFEKPEELRGHISRDLTKLLHEKFLELPLKEEKVSDSSKEQITESESKAPEVSGEEGNHEIADTFKAITKDITEENETDEDRKERLYLFANSLFYKNLSYGIIGNHEIHKLYLRRDSINLYGFERKHILKTLFADKYHLKTGWYWLNDIKTDAIKWYLCWLCVASKGDDQKQCLEMLSNSWPAEIQKTIKQIIRSEEKDNLEYMVSLLSDYGSHSSIRIIDKLGADDDNKLKEARKKAKIRLMVRFKKYQQIVDCIMRIDESEPVSTYTEIESSMHVLDSSSLRTIKAKHSSEKIRSLATLELAKRGEITLDEYKQNINNKNLYLRYHSYINLIKAGEQINPEKVREEWPNKGRSILGGYWDGSYLVDEIIEEIYKKCEIEKLESYIHWSSIDTPLAYYAYGLRMYEEIKNTIISDLKNDFLRIKKDDINRWNAVYEEPLKKISKGGDEEKKKLILTTIKKQTEKYEEQLSKYDELIKTCYARSVLKIIYEKDVFEDKEYLKHLMASDDYEIKDTATKLFIKSSDETDTDDLIQLVINNNSSTGGLAAEKLLELAGTNDILKQLLGSKNEAIIKLCFNYAVENEIVIDEETLFNRLHSKSDGERKLAVAYLLKKNTRKNKFESILNKYMGTSYYYNVVSWIDQILYAPKAIKECGRKELLESLKVE